MDSHVRPELRNNERHPVDHQPGALSRETPLISSATASNIAAQGGYLMSSQPDPTRPFLLQHLPIRLHHHAFVVRDHEINRHFFEDILGMPLVATWCERVFNADVQREVDYCHTFFALADGSALAFFQFADEELYERSKPIFPNRPVSITSRSRSSRRPTRRSTNDLQRPAWRGGRSTTAIAVPSTSPAPMASS